MHSGKEKLHICMPIWVHPYVCERAHRGLELSPTIMHASKKAGMLCFHPV